MRQRLPRLVVSLAGVAVVTFIGFRVIPVNATTVGFAYLLLVLLIASTWGFVEASLTSVVATLCFNFFFLPPIGQLTIADPQNWVALFSFLTTALIASRLSETAKQRALDAIERQQDVERLYTFGRAILLIDEREPFAKQLIQKLAGVFQLEAAVLYERHTGAIYRAGPDDFEGLDEQLQEAALRNSSFSDPERKRLITAIRLGSEPIASIAIQGTLMPDSVLQGIANLIAIGLERAKAQDLAHQIEAARQSEQLRTTLIDAMAHEFKTPLTSIKAATTSLLASPEQPPETRMELLRIADEEAEHLRELIDDAVEMARLSAAQIEVHREMSDPCQIVRDVVVSLHKEIDDRAVKICCDGPVPALAVDRRLLKLALKQMLDNALKYSPPRAPVNIRIHQEGEAVLLEITDYGNGIPVEEQKRIFERFYRSPSVTRRIPGSGLGLSIAHSIARAHNGDLSVSSGPTQTIFRMSLPVDPGGEPN